jgi:hypothetical protein
VPGSDCGRTKALPDGIRCVSFLRTRKSHGDCNDGADEEGVVGAAAVVVTVVVVRVKERVNAHAVSE